MAVLTTCVYSVKTLLEWKRPVHSGVFIIICNFVFWNIVNCSYRCVTIWSLIFLAFVVFDHIVSNIWPTIQRVNLKIKTCIQCVQSRWNKIWKYFKKNKPISDTHQTEETVTDAGSMGYESVTAEEDDNDILQWGYECIDNILEYRELNPEKFLVKTLFICGCTAVIGYYVSGVVLVYSLFVGAQLMFLTNQCEHIIKCIFRKFRNLVSRFQAVISKFIVKFADSSSNDDDDDSDYGDLMLADDAFNEPSVSNTDEEESSAGLPIPSRPPSSLNYDDLSDRESAHSLASDMEFPSFHDPNFDPSSLTLNESMLFDQVLPSLSSLNSGTSVNNQAVSKRSERFASIDFLSSDEDDLLPCPAGHFPSLDATDSRPGSRSQEQINPDTRRNVHIQPQEGGTVAEGSRRRRRRSRTRPTQVPQVQIDDQTVGLFGQLISNVFTNYLSSSVSSSYTNLSSYISSCISPPPAPTRQPQQVTITELPPSDVEPEISDIAEFELVDSDGLE